MGKRRGNKQNHRKSQSSSVLQEAEYSHSAQPTPETEPTQPEAQQQEQTRHQNGQQNKTSLFEIYLIAIKLYGKLPCSKLVGYPIYRLFGGNKLPLLSIPMAFVLTDMIIHQGIGRMMGAYLNPEAADEFHNRPFSVNRFWLLSSMPYAVYRQFEEHFNPRPNR